MAIPNPQLKPDCRNLTGENQCSINTECFWDYNDSACYDIQSKQSTNTSIVGTTPSYTLHTTRKNIKCKGGFEKLKKPITTSLGNVATDICKGIEPINWDLVEVYDTNTKEKLNVNAADNWDMMDCLPDGWVNGSVDWNCGGGGPIECGTVCGEWHYHTGPGNENFCPDGGDSLENADEACSDSCGLNSAEIGLEGNLLINEVVDCTDAQALMHRDCEPEGLAGGCNELFCGDTFGDPCAEIDLGGCTDTSACNFDENALQDDGTCEYCDGTWSCRDDWDCADPGCVAVAGSTLWPGGTCNNEDGSCIGNLVSCDNCCDDCNDGSACCDNDDDGVCDDAIIGCIDPTANNYNPDATVDDGSCTYDILGCMDIDACNYDPDAISQPILPDTCLYITCLDNSCVADIADCPEVGTWICGKDGSTWNEGEGFGSVGCFATGDCCYETVDINGIVWVAENNAQQEFATGDLITSVADLEGDDNAMITWSSNSSIMPLVGSAFPAAGEEIMMTDANGMFTTIWLQNYVTPPNYPGRHYNFLAVNDDRNVCPLGSHVAQAEEWADLIEYSGGENNADAIKAPNSFGALPLGGVIDNNYQHLGVSGRSYFWTGTLYDASTGQAYGLWFKFTGVNDEIIIFNPEFASTYDGMSIRCILDYAGWEEDPIVPWEYETEMWQAFHWRPAEQCILAEPCNPVGSGLPIGCCDEYVSEVAIDLWSDEKLRKQRDESYARHYVNQYNSSQRGECAEHPVYFYGGGSGMGSWQTTQFQHANNFITDTTGVGHMPWGCWKTNYHKESEGLSGVNDITCCDQAFGVYTEINDFWFDGLNDCNILDGYYYYFCGGCSCYLTPNGIGLKAQDMLAICDPDDTSGQSCENWHTYAPYNFLDEVDFSNNPYGSAAEGTAEIYHRGNALAVGPTCPDYMCVGGERNGLYCKSGSINTDYPGAITEQECLDGGGNYTGSDGYVWSNDDTDPTANIPRCMDLRPKDNSNTDNPYHGGCSWGFKYEISGPMGSGEMTPEAYGAAVTPGWNKWDRSCCPGCTTSGQPAGTTPQDVAHLVPQATADGPFGYELNDWHPSCQGPLDQALKSDYLDEFFVDSDADGDGDYGAWTYYDSPYYNDDGNLVEHGPEWALPSGDWGTHCQGICERYAQEVESYMLIPNDYNPDCNTRNISNCNPVNNYWDILANCNDYSDGEFDPLGMVICPDGITCDYVGNCGNLSEAAAGPGYCTGTYVSPGIVGQWYPSNPDYCMESQENCECTTPGCSTGNIYGTAICWSGIWVEGEDASGYYNDDCWYPDNGITVGGCCGYSDMLDACIFKGPTIYQNCMSFCVNEAAVDSCLNNCQPHAGSCIPDNDDDGLCGDADISPDCTYPDVTDCSGTCGGDAVVDGCGMCVCGTASYAANSASCNETFTGAGVNYLDYGCGCNGGSLSNFYWDADGDGEGAGTAWEFCGSVNSVLTSKSCNSICPPETDNLGGATCFGVLVADNTVTGTGADFTEATCPTTDWEYGTAGTDGNCNTTAGYCDGHDCCLPCTPDGYTSGWCSGGTDILPGCPTDTIGCPTIETEDIAFAGGGCCSDSAEFGYPPCGYVDVCGNCITTSAGGGFSSSDSVTATGNYTEYGALLRTPIGCIDGLDSAGNDCFLAGCNGDCCGGDATLNGNAGTPSGDCNYERLFWKDNDGDGIGESTAGDFLHCSTPGGDTLVGAVCGTTAYGTASYCLASAGDDTDLACESNLRDCNGDCRPMATPGPNGDVGDSTYAGCPLGGDNLPLAAAGKGCAFADPNYDDIYCFHPITGFEGATTTAEGACVGGWTYDTGLQLGNNPCTLRCDGHYYPPEPNGGIGSVGAKEDNCTWCCDSWDNELTIANEAWGGSYPVNKQCCGGDIGDGIAGSGCLSCGCNSLATACTSTGCSGGNEDGSSETPGECCDCNCAPVSVCGTCTSDGGNWQVAVCNAGGVPQCTSDDYCPDGSPGDNSGAYYNFAECPIYDQYCPEICDAPGTVTQHKCAEWPGGVDHADTQDFPNNYGAYCNSSGNPDECLSNVEANCYRIDGCGECKDILSWPFDGDGDAAAGGLPCNNGEEGGSPGSITVTVQINLVGGSTEDIDYTAYYCGNKFYCPDSTDGADPLLIGPITNCDVTDCSYDASGIASDIQNDIFDSCGAASDIDECGICAGDISGHDWNSDDLGCQCGGPDPLMGQEDNKWYLDHDGDGWASNPTSCGTTDSNYCQIVWCPNYTSGPGANKNVRTSTSIDHYTMADTLCCGEGGLAGTWGQSSGACTGGTVPCYKTESNEENSWTQAPDAGWDDDYHDCPCNTRGCLNHDGGTWSGCCIPGAEFGRCTAANGYVQCPVEDGCTNCVVAGEEGCIPDGGGGHTCPDYMYEGGTDANNSSYKTSDCANICSGGHVYKSYYYDTDGDGFGDADCISPCDYNDYDCDSDGLHDGCCWESCSNADSCVNVCNDEGSAGAVTGRRQNCGMDPDTDATGTCQSNQWDCRTSSGYYDCVPMDTWECDDVDAGCWMPNQLPATMLAQSSCVFDNTVQSGDTLTLVYIGDPDVTPGCALKDKRDNCRGGDTGLPVAEQDCAGVWGYTDESTFKIWDACGVCSFPNTSTIFEYGHECCVGDMIDIGDGVLQCSGSWVAPDCDNSTYDANGVCTGISSCASDQTCEGVLFDCACECNGILVIDACGKCDGDAIPSNCTDLTWVGINGACNNMDCFGHCISPTPGFYGQGDGTECMDGDCPYGSATFNVCGLCTGGAATLPEFNPNEEPWIAKGSVGMTYSFDCHSVCSGTNSWDECEDCVCFDTGKCGPSEIDASTNTAVYNDAELGCGCDNSANSPIAYALDVDSDAWPADPGGTLSYYCTTHGNYIPATHSASNSLCAGACPLVSSIVIGCGTARGGLCAVDGSMVVPGTSDYYSTPNGPWDDTFPDCSCNYKDCSDTCCDNDGTCGAEDSIPSCHAIDACGNCGGGCTCITPTCPWGGAGNAGYVANCDSGAGIGIGSVNYIAGCDGKCYADDAGEVQETGSARCDDCGNGDLWNCDPEWCGALCYDPVSIGDEAANCHEGLTAPCSGYEIQPDGCFDCGCQDILAQCNGYGNGSGSIGSNTPGEVCNCQCQIVDDCGNCGGNCDGGPAFTMCDESVPSTYCEPGGSDAHGTVCKTADCAGICEGANGYNAGGYCSGGANNCGQDACGICNGGGSGGTGQICPNANGDANCLLWTFDCDNFSDWADYVEPQNAPYCLAVGNCDLTNVGKGCGCGGDSGESGNTCPAYDGCGNCGGDCTSAGEGSASCGADGQNDIITDCEGFCACDNDGNCTGALWDDCNNCRGGSKGAPTGNAANTDDVGVAWDCIPDSGSCYHIPAGTTEGEDCDCDGNTWDVCGDVCPGTYSGVVDPNGNVISRGAIAPGGTSENVVCNCEGDTVDKCGKCLETGDADRDKTCTGCDDGGACNFNARTDGAGNCEYFLETQCFVSDAGHCNPSAAVGCGGNCTCYYDGSSACDGDWDITASLNLTCNGPLTETCETTDTCPTSCNNGCHTTQGTLDTGCCDPLACNYHINNDGCAGNEGAGVCDGDTCCLYESNAPYDCSTYHSGTGHTCGIATTCSAGTCGSGGGADGQSGPTVCDDGCWSIADANCGCGTAPLSYDCVCATGCGTNECVPLYNSTYPGGCNEAGSADGYCTNPVYDWPQYLCSQQTGTAGNYDCVLGTAADGNVTSCQDPYGCGYLDECGVCGGNNSSCTDYCGVVNGNGKSCCNENGVATADCAPPGVWGAACNCACDCETGAQDYTDYCFTGTVCGACSAGYFGWSSGSGCTACVINCTGSSSACYATGCTDATHGSCNSNSGACDCLAAYDNNSNVNCGWCASGYCSDGAGTCSSCDTASCGENGQCKGISGGDPHTDCQDWDTADPDNGNICCNACDCTDIDWAGNATCTECIDNACGYQCSTCPACANGAGCIGSGDHTYVEWDVCDCDCTQTGGNWTGNNCDVCVSPNCGDNCELIEDECGECAGDCSTCSDCPAPECNKYLDACGECGGPSNGVCCGDGDCAGLLDPDCINPGASNSYCGCNAGHDSGCNCGVYKDACGECGGSSNGVCCNDGECNGLISPDCINPGASNSACGCVAGQGAGCNCGVFLSGCDNCCGCSAALDDCSQCGGPCSGNCTCCDSTTCTDTVSPDCIEAATTSSYCGCVTGQDGGCDCGVYKDGCGNCGGSSNDVCCNSTDCAGLESPDCINPAASNSYCGCSAGQDSGCNCGVFKDACGTCGGGGGSDPACCVDGDCTGDISPNCIAFSCGCTAGQDAGCDCGVTKDGCEVCNGSAGDTPACCVDGDCSGATPHCNNYVCECDYEDTACDAASYDCGQPWSDTSCGTSTCEHCDDADCGLVGSTGALNCHWEGIHGYANGQDYGGCKQSVEGVLEASCLCDDGITYNYGAYACTAAPCNGVITTSNVGGGGCCSMDCHRWNTDLVGGNTSITAFPDGTNNWDYGACVNNSVLTCDYPFNDYEWCGIECRCMQGGTNDTPGVDGYVPWIEKCNTAFSCIDSFWLSGFMACTTTMMGHDLACWCPDSAGKGECGYCADSGTVGDYAAEGGYIGGVARTLQTSSGRTVNIYITSDDPDHLHNQQPKATQTEYGLQRHTKFSELRIPRWAGIQDAYMDGITMWYVKYAGQIYEFMEGAVELFPEAGLLPDGSPRPVSDPRTWAGAEILSAGQSPGHSALACESSGNLTCGLDVDGLCKCSSNTGPLNSSQDKTVVKTKPVASVKRTQVGKLQEGGNITNNNQCPAGFTLAADGSCIPG